MRCPMVMIALMIGAAFWRAARISFLSDDYVLVSMAQAFQAHYGAMFTQGGGDGFFRPLGYISLAWTSPWAGLDPNRWHWAGLLLHLGNSLLVYTLAGAIGLSRAVPGWRRHCSPGMGRIRKRWCGSRAGSIFSRRSSGCWRWYAFIKLWEESSWRWGFAAWLVSRLALLSKESAYGIPLAMLVYVGFRPGSWNRRIRYLAPFVLLAAILFAYRWTLQGGIGGYLGPGGQPQALSLHPVLSIEALALRLWAVLFFPMNWAVGAGAWLGIAMAGYAVAWAALIWSVAGAEDAAADPSGIRAGDGVAPGAAVADRSGLGEIAAGVFALGGILLAGGVGCQHGRRYGWPRAGALPSRSSLSISPRWCIISPDGKSPRRNRQPCAKRDLMFQPGLRDWAAEEPQRRVFLCQRTAGMRSNGARTTPRSTPACVLAGLGSGGRRATLDGIRASLVA